jgi:hypothetical protein
MGDRKMDFSHHMDALCAASALLQSEFAQVHADSM